MPTLNRSAYPVMTELKDAGVLVLGAGQGIGREAALALAASGARVACIDVDDQRAARVAAEVNGLDIVADATDRAQVARALAQAAAEFGSLRVLIDVIGIPETAPIAAIDDAAWQRALDRNLRHAFLTLQLGPRHMPEGGSIVFVASTSGLRSSPTRAGYGAAKAGLLNLVRTASIELAPRIRVNAVAPGHILTPREVARLGTTPGLIEHQAELVPLARMGDPSDIAAALLFFASDMAAWVTGQALVVDGGMSRKYQYDL